jgi:hypothetical protein
MQHISGIRRLTVVFLHRTDTHTQLIQTFWHKQISHTKLYPNIRHMQLDTPK